MLGREIEDFIARWSPSGGGELSNYQLFLAEMCDVLGVPRPDPAVPDDTLNAYVFDRSIPRQEADGSTTPNFIDLYKRGCFICETKQGVEVGRVAPRAPSGFSRTAEPPPRSDGAHGVTRPTNEPSPQLTAKERLIHEQGLVSVLKQIHDDLAAAVFHAYGWDDLVGTRSTASPSSVNEARDPVKQVPTAADVDEVILERLVGLNGNARGLGQGAANGGRQIQDLVMIPDEKTRIRLLLTGIIPRCFTRQTLLPLFAPVPTIQQVRSLQYLH